MLSLGSGQVADPCVIGDDDQILLPFQRLMGGRQHDGGLVGRVDRHRAIERPERNGPTRLGAQNEAHDATLGSQGVGHGAGQGRLADPALAEQSNPPNLRTSLEGR